MLYYHNYIILHYTILYQNALLNLRICIAPLQSLVHSRPPSTSRFCRTPDTAQIWCSTDKLPPVPWAPGRTLSTQTMIRATGADPWNIVMTCDDMVRHSALLPSFPASSFLPLGTLLSKGPRTQQHRMLRQLNISQLLQPRCSRDFDRKDVAEMEFVGLPHSSNCLTGCHDRLWPAGIHLSRKTALYEYRVKMHEQNEQVHHSSSSISVSSDFWEVFRVWASNEWQRQRGSFPIGQCKCNDY